MMKTGIPKMMKIDCFYPVRYTEDDFPNKFFDEEFNLIATDKEIIDWAKEQFFTDMYDIMINDCLYLSDIKTRIKR